MVNQKLKDEIWEYCRLNDITDINEFIQRMTQQGFNTEKYGATPFKPEIIEKEVIKEIPVEVVREIIKEIPVEKVVEKEIVKEIPIEKEVIKEVPVEVIKEIEKVVEREVYVTDDEMTNKLQKEVFRLTELVGRKTEESKIWEQEYLDSVDDANVRIESLNQKITDLSNEISQLKQELVEVSEKRVELENKIGQNSDQELINKLNRKIENLEIELELEKNRHYEKPKRENPIDEKPKKNTFGNIISWVSRTERDEEDDIYGE